MAKMIDVYLHDQQLYAPRQIDVQLDDVSRPIEVILRDHMLVCDVITSIVPATLPVTGLPTAMILDSAASISLGRCRLLSEMDGNELEDYDSMRLDEVDYIVIS